jgi:hypothetical protein
VSNLQTDEIAARRNIRSLLNLRWRTPLSFVEHIALREHAELETVVGAAAVGEFRPGYETRFVEDLRRGDTAAFDRLVAERTGDIYALLLRLTQDAEEARDLTQETFCKLSQHQRISRRRRFENMALPHRRQSSAQPPPLVDRRRRDETVSLDHAATDHEQTTLGARLQTSMAKRLKPRLCAASANTC